MHSSHNTPRVEVLAKGLAQQKASLFVRSSSPIICPDDNGIQGLQLKDLFSHEVQNRAVSKGGGSTDRVYDFGSGNQSHLTTCFE
jgi:hypothetical protein